MKKENKNERKMKMKNKEKEFIERFSNSGLTVRVLVGEKGNNVLHIKDNKLIAPLSVDFEIYKVIEPHLSEEIPLSQDELLTRLSQIEKMFGLTVL
jgi:hypothetical protein